MDFKLKNEKKEKYTLLDVILLSAVTLRYLEGSMNNFINNVDKIQKEYQNLIYEHLLIYTKTKKRGEYGQSLPVNNFNRTVPEYYMLISEFSKIYYTSMDTSPVRIGEEFGSFSPSAYINIPKLNREDANRIYREYGGEITILIQKILNNNVLKKALDIDEETIDINRQLFESITFDENRKNYSPWHTYVFIDHLYYWLYGDSNSSPFIQFKIRGYLSERSDSAYMEKLFKRIDLSKDSDENYFSMNGVNKEEEKNIITLLLSGKNDSSTKDALDSYIPLIGNSNTIEKIMDKISSFIGVLSKYPLREVKTSLEKGASNSKDKNEPGKQDEVRVVLQQKNKNAEELFAFVNKIVRNN